MQRVGRALLVSCAPLALVCGYLIHDVSDLLHADGGHGRGLELRITDRDSTGETPLFEGPDPAPDLARIRALGLDDGQHRFDARWTGWLRVPTEGTYGFATLSDDGSRLGLDGSWVVKNGGIHGPRSRGASRTLLAGWYPFELEYTQAGADLALEVTWDPPDLPRQRIDPASFVATAPGPMTLWWIENAREPALAHRGLLTGVGAGAAALAALGLALIVAGSEGGRRSSARILIATSSALSGTPTRRRFTGLALVLVGCVAAWMQNEALRGGFRAEYRSLATSGPGPWLGGNVDAGSLLEGRADPPGLSVPLPLEQRTHGWVFADRDGFYWFSVGGGLQTALSIDGLPLLEHDGAAEHGAVTRERMWLRIGTHRLEYSAVRREGREDRCELRWAPPDEPFRAFAAGDVFPDLPGPAQLESQLRNRDARRVEPRVAALLIGIAALALAGSRLRVRVASAHP